MPRPRVVLLLIAVVSIALVPVAYWRVTRIEDLAEALVRDANAYANARWPRPSHVDAPLPGRFGDLALKHGSVLGELHEAYRQLPKSLQDRTGEIREGKRPFADLPGEVEDMMDRGGEDVRGILTATHAIEAGPVAGIDLFMSDADELSRNGFRRFHMAARLATLRMRQLMELRRHDEAVALCLDVMALGRDVGIGTSLLGEMVGVAVHRMAFGPCAAALDAASPEQQERAADRLETILSATPHVAEHVRGEAMMVALILFPPLLTAEQRAQLPKRAIRLHQSGPDGLQGFPEPLARLLLTDTWHRHVRYFAGLPEVLRAPASEREEKARALQEEVVVWFNPLSQAGFIDLSRFAERDDLRRSGFQALIALTRADAHRERQGTWPPLDLAGVKLTVGDTRAEVTIEADADPISFAFTSPTAEPLTAE